MSYIVSLKAFDGRQVALLEEDWLHIRFRHPEVGFRAEPLSEALTHPDEAYRNGRGGIHALKRVDDEHLLAVIYEPTDNEELVRTAYLTSAQRKDRRFRSFSLPETILELDLKKILVKVEARYGVDLPRKVVAVDFGSTGDLYMRFKHAPRPVGEPTDDGLAIFFYDDGGSPVGVELLDTDRFT